MTITQAIQMSATTDKPLNVLAVDDEIFNLEILSEWLKDWGCVVETAEDGKQAVQILEHSPQRFDVVLLDRMMPEMGGLEVLAYMNQRDSLKHIPVILQTAAATISDIQTGIDAGVQYYLTKPFTQNSLCKMVEVAVYDASLYHRLKESLQQPSTTDLTQETHQFRTIQDVERLSGDLAKCCGDPVRVVTGLYELMINAVEHGNLEINYDEKNHLLAQNIWLDEINKRLQIAEYAQRYGSIEVCQAGNETHYLIKDQGAGFDFNTYLDIAPERVSHHHGRGIALANKQSFDRLEYRNCGNEVLAVVVNK